MKYPVALYFITLAIILSVTLADWHYLVGTDIHLSAYFAQMADRYGWQPAIAHPGNSALGDVLLTPAFGIWLTFKIIFPMLFAAVPVIMYFIYRRFLQPAEAFLAALFFASVPAVTMELPAIPRQMLAEFFMAIFLYILFAVPKPLLKTILLIVTGSLVIVSHYSVGIILILMMIAYALIMLAMAIFRQKLSLPLQATGVIAFLLLVIGVSYYGSVAGGTPLKYMTAIAPVKVQVGTTAIGYTIAEQNQIKEQNQTAEQNGTVQSAAEQATENKIEANRVKLLTGGTVSGLMKSYDNVMRAALGFDFLKATVLGKIYRVIQFITFALIIIGSVYAICSRRMRAAIKPEYLAFILICGGVLCLCVLSPGFASILNGTRWYHISLFALAPMLVIGMKVILGRANVTQA